MQDIGQIRWVVLSKGNQLHILGIVQFKEHIDILYSQLYSTSLQDGFLYYITGHSKGKRLYNISIMLHDVWYRADHI